MAVPVTQAPLGIVVLIVNIFLPGIGTIIASVVGETDEQTKWTVFGVIQFLTSWLLVGWVWALVNSIQIVKAQQG